MALRKIFVIDESEAVRETLAVILGGTYEVHDFAPNDCSPSAVFSTGRANVVIANADTTPAAWLRAIANSGCPVIWLRADSSQGPPVREVAGAFVVLPHQFSGQMIAENVRALLDPAVRRAEPIRTRNQLAHPYLPEEAALVAHEAGTNQLPVLIIGEPGTGRARIAAAIHMLGSTHRFAAMAPQHCTASALQALAGRGEDITLFVDDVGTASAEMQALLLEVAESSGLVTAGGWLGIRLITGSTGDLESLAYSGAFSRDLYYRLSVLPIRLVPLRDRPADIPALARAIATELCSTLGCAPVSFTPRAMQRLSRYLWFGNIAELETVLARTVSLVHKEVIDVGDLLFGYGRVAPVDKPTAAHSDRATPPLATSAVDLIINELAHEFKNPLVTIKTFAQHLERLLDEEGGRDQLMRLTGEAVDRMDRALENLLEFTRFQEPAAQSVPLGALLSPALAELGPLLSERRLTLDYRPPSGGMTVTVDPAHLSYAFNNLLRALIRSVCDGESISVLCAEPGTVTVRVPSAKNGISGRLGSLLSSRGSGEESPLPLGLALARSLIKRNGGQLEVEEGSGGPAVTIQLPSQADARKMQ